MSLVCSRAGGIQAAAAPGQLPRNERQVKYLKHAAKSSSYNPADELYSVMFQAKQEDQNNTFVRDIKVLPDPAILIAKDYQLDDLVRFSTNSTEHCILTIDPTFSLGDFDVTLITYRHLLLETQRSGNTPVCRPNSCTLQEGLSKLPFLCLELSRFAKRSGWIAGIRH